MDTVLRFLRLDLQTVILMVVGIVLGGLITLWTSAYYAKKSAKDMEKAISKAGSDLTTQIPGAAAQRVIQDNTVNAILAAGPIVFKLLHRQQVAPQRLE